MARAKPADFGLEPTMRSPADAPGPRANRTIAKILDATRSVFLTRGYAGTTIDEIATAAGISRASFYTYFPTKRDALLALGADSAEASQRVVESFGAMDPAAFVDAYFAMLDEHGSFALAWTQAAHEDDEIREAGMKRHLAICRGFGRAVGKQRGNPLDDPTAFGLAFFSLCERSWSYGHLYEGAVDTASVRAEVTAVLTATLRPT
jgi:TetR/AcrR family transcriptional regulator